MDSTHFDFEMISNGTESDDYDIVNKVEKETFYPQISFYESDRTSDGIDIQSLKHISLSIDTDTCTSHVRVHNSGRNHTVWHDSFEGVDLLESHSEFIKAE